MFSQIYIAIQFVQLSDVSGSLSRILFPRFNPVIQLIDLSLSVFAQIAASVVGGGVLASLSKTLHVVRAQVIPWWRLCRDSLSWRRGWASIERQIHFILVPLIFPESVWAVYESSCSSPWPPGFSLPVVPCTFKCCLGCFWLLWFCCYSYSYFFLSLIKQQNPRSSTCSHLKTTCRPLHPACI